GDQVFPVHADAHDLPYADEFFDGLVSVDAYHYFGGDDDQLGRCIRLVRPGGLISVIVPGRTTDGSDEPTFHSPEWWRELWTGNDEVAIERAEMLPSGWDLWHRFCQAAAAWDGRDRVADVPDG